MESIYAALLLHKVGGKITETNLEKILTAAGAKVDKDQLAKVIAGFKEANIDEIIKSASTAPVVTTTATAHVEEKKEEKKKKKEEEEEEEPTGIGSLF
jgi:ribosomal protein L12E/L44/L45/RPP1/RPP2